MSNAVPPDRQDHTDKPVVLMYESRWCGFCRAARRLLEQKGWAIDARMVDGKADLRREMTERAGRTSVPQIWIGDTHIGGFDALAALEDDGKLEPLYAAAQSAASDPTDH